MPHTRRTVNLAALACAAAPVVSLGAANHPHRPVRIVVGGPAGGTSDLLARALAELLGSRLGQPVLVDNRPGASGLLGMQELLNAPRDGNTWMVGVSGLAAEVPHVVHMPFDPLVVLRPLVDMGRTGLLLVGAATLPPRDLPALMAHLRSRVDKFSFASYSAGSVSHTLGLAFNRLADADMAHVSYRGSPPALVDVAGGNVTVMFDGPAGALPLIRAGKLRAYATTAPKRLAALPDVPTCAELGFESLTEVPWVALWTTPDTPAAVQDRMREASLPLVMSASMRERMLALGMEPGSGATPAEMMQSLRLASDRQAARLRAIGFKKP